MGKNTVQTLQWLKKIYPGFVPSQSMVEESVKSGRTSVDNTECSGHPNEVDT